MENSDKIRQSLQKDINRIRKTCTQLGESNKLRKHEIKQFNMFIKKLLKENRITKDEISQFMDKKENVKINFK
jgi:3-oxoacyl-[acyl-carrier-protein] synthase III